MAKNEWPFSEEKSKEKESVLKYVRWTENWIFRVTLYFLRVGLISSLLSMSLSFTGQFLPI